MVAFSTHDVGVWNKERDYKIGDIVNKGETKIEFVCVLENKGIEPPNEEYWYEFSDPDKRG